ncbi:DNA sulfur modification protein DndD [[Limnothrix rosea] IAM M-220]|uniref:DNA sulfur modification protein DndD n=1 Tax=[Limnothrix rosea] IAM M-220 TaxID=454133 RepID=UPI0009666F1C|nr:DNA sulfur modification protein DndD [[Limnothrix rosea] IAM M-220]OKH19065.1 DNA sulfur modification protein DndD [[Limnothrix rosea] IAM M-220]
MIFKTLILENFGPYSGRQTLDLSPTETSPIILIGGMNGGGKTTLMDSLRLVLYGQRAQCSSRGSMAYSDFLEQCINRASAEGETTAVELIFRHSITGAPTEYHIRRSWQNVPKPKENLEIFIRNIVEGEPISLPDPALAKMWDERIEELLPLGISNLFLFDGEQIKELAEQDNPPPEVVNAIQSLLGLELSDRLSLDLKILKDRKAKALANKTELQDFETLEKRFAEQDDQRKIIKQKLSDLQNKVDVAKKNASELLDIFKMRGGEITAERTKLETEKQQLQQKLDSDRQALRTLAAQALPLSLIQPLLNRAQTQAQAELESQQAELTSQILGDRNQKLLDFAKAKKFPAAKLKQLENFLQIELEQIQIQADVDIPKLGIDAESLSYLKLIASQLLPDQIHRAQQLKKQIQDTLLNIDAGDRQLAAAAPPEEFDQLAQQVDEANQKVIKLQTEYQTTEQELAQLTAIVEDTKQKLSQYGKKIFERQNNEHTIQAIDRVQTTLKTFRQQLKIRKIDHLESAVTECFRYLIRKADFVGRITIDIETFALHLYDAQGQPLPKNRLSAGEKQLLATALLWGLARVSGRNLPVAIDTPLGRLDSSHRKNLLERYFPTASHQVLLLSTDTEIGQKEAKQLGDSGAIASEYLLEYDISTCQTTIKSGYFW